MKITASAGLKTIAKPARIPKSPIKPMDKLLFVNFAKNILNFKVTIFLILFEFLYPQDLSQALSYTH